MTDPIADMLTHIRNAVAVRKDTTTMPSSKQKVALAHLLAKEGFIESYEENELPGNKKDLTLALKYSTNGTSVISGVKRVSKPSRRVYVAKDELPIVQNGYGIAVISTSKGLMTNKQAKTADVGGEYMCEVS